MRRTSWHLGGRSALGGSRSPAKQVVRTAPRRDCSTGDRIGVWSRSESGGAASWASMRPLSSQSSSRSSGRLSGVRTGRNWIGAGDRRLAPAQRTRPAQARCRYARCRQRWEQYSASRRGGRNSSPHEAHSHGSATSSCGAHTPSMPTRIGRPARSTRRPNLSSRWKCNHPRPEIPSQPSCEGNSTAAFFHRVAWAIQRPGHGRHRLTRHQTMLAANRGRHVGAPGAEGAFKGPRLTFRQPVGRRPSCDNDCASPAGGGPAGTAFPNRRGAAHSLSGGGRRLSELRRIAEGCFAWNLDAALSPGGWRIRPRGGACNDRGRRRGVRE